jgi:malate dehydrogenase (oxaloacetate-decarboxylating)(NADP+)
MADRTRITRDEALAYHLEPSPGKIDISASTPMTTQRDLSLAYSPGVAVPCELIAENPEPPMTTRTRATSLP